MKAQQKNRNRLLIQIEKIFEVPLIVLGFVWLALLIVELVQGPAPWLNITSNTIWVVFVLDFLGKLWIAPRKGIFLRSNVITLISLAIPVVRVLRIFRVLRLFRFTRGLRLVKVIGSLNRGMRSLSKTMKRRAAGYVLLLTLTVTFAGAAGMYAFESQQPNGLHDYGTALWWTTMIMTTLGSEYWPVTPEGRILCIILSLFAFAVFGYITATIATFFVGQDAEDETAEIAGSKQIAQLRDEVALLRNAIEQLLAERKTPPR